MALEDPNSFPSIADLERQHNIPPDKYCGLTPEEMSRAILACDAGPRMPGTPDLEARCGIEPDCPDVPLVDLQAERSPNQFTRPALDVPEHEPAETHAAV